MEHNKADLNFVAESKKRLEKILQRLGWSEEKVLKDFNSNSVASSNKENIKKVSSPKIAYYPDSCISQNSVIIDTLHLQEILEDKNVKAPVNVGELQINFSREQKLKIYDYVIENTQKLENTKEITGTEGELSLADILAQKKREEKHKKRRFRKSKPTHIEEVRCLVDLQMQALQQYMGSKIEKGCRELQTKKNNEPYEKLESRYNKELSYGGERKRDNKKLYENYNIKEGYKDGISKHRKYHNLDNFKYRHRSSNKDHSFARGCSRSRSKERRIHHISYDSRRLSSHERRKRSRSRNKEILFGSKKINRSHSKDISHQSRRKSNERRKRSRSRNKESKRRSTSRSKDFYYDRKRRSRIRSTSYETRNRTSTKDYTKRRSRREYYDSYGSTEEKSSYIKYRKN